MKRLFHLAILIIPLTTKAINMSIDTGAKKNMVLTYTFHASPEQVWKAWSDGNLVMRWWGPKVFTAPVVKMDFREGGTTLVCMRSPDGHDMYSTWHYQKIVPLQRIEYLFKFSDKDGKQLDPAAIGLPPGIPKEVPHVVTFKDLGNGNTEVTVTEYGYANDQIVEMSKAGMKECLDKMAAVFDKK
jgi:uncharacterized protein YndB with AHSA1/START domain